MKRILSGKATAFLAVCFVITFVWYIAAMSDLQNTSEIIPAVSEGKFVLFEGEMGKYSVVSDIEMTEDYIFFAYSTSGVVAAYDWAGDYQFSLAFFSDTNGGLGIRCEDGLLYVCDHQAYEYVFEGRELLERKEPSDSEHSIAWFNEHRDLPIQIQKNGIYDDAGNYVMQMPGRLADAQFQLMPVVFLCVAIIAFICGKRRKH